MASIVKLIVSETVAPAPITLQSKGALISQGGTNLPAGTYSLLTQKSDLNPLIANTALNIASIVWSGGVATVTTSIAIPGLVATDTFITTLTSVTPPAYNGTYIATVTGGNTFTVPIAVNPGAESVPGTYTPPNQGELFAMVNSFFSQGTGQAVYVLELGPADGTSGPPLLNTFITNNPNFFYSYLVPRNWDAKSAFLALAAEFEALTALTYFFVTSSISTYSAYTPLEKSVLWGVEAPSTQTGGYPPNQLRPLTEFSMAAIFQVTLNYAPSSSNRQTQLRYAYLNGVTPYPAPSANNALLNAIATANGTYVGTGAEGGISKAIVAGGTTADGNDFTYNYAIDWLQLQSDRSVSNAVINGSNDPENPLYYDQQGVNTLQDVEVQVVKNGISFGLINGTVGRATLVGPDFQQNFDDGDYVGQDIVNAVPFLDYVEENESAYTSGTYGGLQVVFIPMRGFKQVIINLQVNNLFTAPG